VWLRAEPGRRRIRAHIEGAPGAAVTLASGTAHADNRWHHFALQRDGRRARLYLDGRRVDAASGVRGSVSPSRPFTIDIGRRPDGRHHLNGALDDYRLYTRALTGREIRKLAATRPGVKRRLRLHLRFDAAR
jgi:sialidase-1